MYRSTVRLLTVLVLTEFIVSCLPARAQAPIIQSSDFFVTSSNTFFPLLPFISNIAYSIHVHHKVAAQPTKVPVLLVHGTWGNAQTWDFPGRSVMDYLALRGYDVYALDLRGEGQFVPADGSAVDFSKV